MKSMKKYAMQTLVALALIGTSVYAMATTITFDDLTPTRSGLNVENGYAGLDWENFGVIAGNVGGGGYNTGTISPENAAFNNYAQPASFSSSTAFTLNSLYLTRAWEAGNTHIEGYAGSSLLYSVDVFATTTTPQFLTFNWSGLTSVKFTTIGGDGSHMAIDNITINAVPEPETYAMLFAGLGMLGAIARRRQQRT